jgi:uncharacterized LabA/DUF88 family protein
MSEVPVKEAIVFVDGQNLFKSAKDAFGYTYPNYDVMGLALAVCAMKGWHLKQTRFYTGIPDPEDNRFWNHFWAAKLLALSRAGAYTFSRPLRYRTKVVLLPDGTQHSFVAAEEKGIDVRIALDVIRLAHRAEFDVGIIFSQDQDLNEVAREVRALAQEQGRWIKLASAFPVRPASRNRRGVDGTDWIPIDQHLYAANLDPVDYRSGRASS